MRFIIILTGLLFLSVTGSGCEKVSGNLGTAVNGGTDSNPPGDTDSASDTDADKDSNGGNDTDKAKAGESCEVLEDCETGLICEGSLCVPGGECGSSEFGITHVAPNFIIILDRSCSMTGSKWPAAVQAVNAIVTNYSEDIRFGLALYPDGLGTGDSQWEISCRQDPTGSITVPAGEGTGTAITDILTKALDNTDPNYPNAPCQTNTYAAISQAMLDPAIAKGDRPTYFMLITDGEATCLNEKVGGGDITAINDLLAELLKNEGIYTFVVGFGNEVNPDDMNSHAVAGGTALDSDPQYYQANDEAALLDATSNITGAIVSCNYKLDAPPPDDEEMFIFFNDKDQIMKDTSHKNGWDYEASTNSIDFYGTACDAIKNRENNNFDIDVVFGCPKPVID